MQKSIVDLLRLTLISFLSLYFELTLIRWIPTQVRLLAYFTNFVLIAALLGLGVGMLLARARVGMARYFPIGLLVLAGTVILLERSNFVLPIVSGGWFYFMQLGRDAVLEYLVLVAFFLLMVLVFMPLGQEVGRQLRLVKNPILGYSVNILGSLVGVLGFALLSAMQTPPAVWFVVGGALFLAYLVSTRFRIAPVALAFAVLSVLLACVFLDDRTQIGSFKTYWSPYYKVEVAKRVSAGQAVGYTIRVNKDNHQYAFDLSGRFARLPQVEQRRRLYSLPYSFLHPRKILVLGAGSGNDVAVALRQAPKASIDAVEIDPVIARLGRELHPNHPYQNHRVRVHVDDARSFLQRTNRKYDLIVFGLLDSHRVFSQMSSVRLDNFVYTREDFETVRKRLSPHGVVALTFSIPEAWIANRIFAMLDRVFGHPPLVYQGNGYTYGTMFLTSRHSLHPPAAMPRISHRTFIQQILGSGRWTWRYGQAQGFLSHKEFTSRGVQLTDDWPYLYLNDRTIPPNYLVVLVLTALVSVTLVAFAVPKIDLKSAANWNFFLLGAAFALQETRGITSIALLFGSTWITNIVVISAILLVILIANIAWQGFRHIPPKWLYPPLVALLLFNYAVPLRGLLAYGFWVQVVISGLAIAAPLFFSGLLFAGFLARTQSTSSALGANLMGAVLGSLAEYSSLVMGLRNLYLVATLFYLASFGTYSLSGSRLPLFVRSSAAARGEVEIPG